MSITNVVTGLRVINGVLPPSECVFIRPETAEDFDKPWQFTPGVMNMKFTNGVDTTNAQSLTKEKLLEALAAKHKAP